MLPNGYKGTVPSERLFHLDIIRGIAVLGILSINIIGMGLHYVEIQGPVSTDLLDTASWYAWFIPALFFEGSFRTIFGILFGAGMSLFLLRTRQKYGRKKARIFHLKRSLWLMIFGVIDLYLFLWYGDVLFLYGFIGLFLWLLNDLGTGKLVIFLGMVFLISFALKISGSNSTKPDADLVRVVTLCEEKLASGKALTDSDSKQCNAAQFSWYISTLFSPSKEKIDQQIKAIQSGYGSTFQTYLPLIVIIQTLVLLFLMLWDSLISMTIGMILLRTGFLQGGLQTKVYLAFIITGYGIALPLRAWMLLIFSDSGFDLAVFDQFFASYDFFRISLALAHISLIVLLINSNKMIIASYLSAAGKMALTNYLMQSMIGLTIFILAGFYAKIDRASLYMIVFSVWIFQLWFSKYWIDRYSQGPLERLWRYLTYDNTNGKDAGTEADKASWSGKERKQKASLR